MLLERKTMTNLDSVLKSRDITLLTKLWTVKAMVFAVVMYGWESWTILKAEYWRTDALNSGVGEDSCESLGLQGDQTSQPKETQPWIFIGRTDAEAEVPILWPPDEKCRLIGKNPDAGTDWRQEDKGMIEGEMIGWHHWLSGHEFDKFWEMVKDREAWRAAFHGIAKCRTWQSNLIELIGMFKIMNHFENRVLINKLTLKLSYVCVYIYIYIYNYI